MLNRIGRTCTVPYQPNSGNAYTGPLMVIYENAMLHFGAEWPSNQKILIADTILTKPGPQPGFKVLGSKYILGERFCFYHMFKINFSKHNKIWKSTKKIWGNCPRMPHRVCGPGQNCRLKVFHWGP